MLRFFFISSSLLIFSFNAFSESLYLDDENSSSVMSPKCPYFKLYKTDENAVIKYTDDQPEPSNFNCIRVIGVPGIEKESCYPKGYTTCPENSTSKSAQIGEPAEYTNYTYSKKSCGYIKNPIIDQLQEFEYCHCEVTKYKGPTPNSRYYN